MSKRTDTNMYDEATLQIERLVGVLLGKGITNISIKEKKTWDRYEREHIISLEVSTKMSFVIGTSKGE